jgi:hypothetical protein
VAAWAAAGDGRQTRPAVAARHSLPLRIDCLPESSADVLWRLAPLVKGQVYSAREPERGGGFVSIPESEAALLLSAPARGVAGASSSAGIPRRSRAAVLISRDGQRARGP